MQCVTTWESQRTTYVKNLVLQVDAPSHGAPPSRVLLSNINTFSWPLLFRAIIRLYSALFRRSFPLLSPSFSPLLSLGGELDPCTSYLASRSLCSSSTKGFRAGWSGWRHTKASKEKVAKEWSKKGACPRRRTKYTGTASFSKGLSRALSFLSPPKQSTFVCRRTVLARFTFHPSDTRRAER